MYQDPRPNDGLYGTALAGLVMAVARGLYWLDSVIAAVIAVGVAVGAVRLLGEALRAP